MEMKQDIDRDATHISRPGFGQEGTEMELSYNSGDLDGVETRRGWR